VSCPAGDSPPVFAGNLIPIIALFVPFWRCICYQQRQVPFLRTLERAVVSTFTSAEPFSALAFVFSSLSVPQSISPHVQFPRYRCLARLFPPGVRRGIRRGRMLLHFFFCLSERFATGGPLLHPFLLFVYEDLTSHRVLHVLRFPASALGYRRQSPRRSCSFFLRRLAFFHQSLLLFSSFTGEPCRFIPPWLFQSAEQSEIAVVNLRTALDFSKSVPSFSVVVSLVPNPSRSPQSRVRPDHVRRF